MLITSTLVLAVLLSALYFSALYRHQRRRRYAGDTRGATLGQDDSLTILDQTRGTGKDAVTIVRHTHDRQEHSRAMMPRN